MSAVKRMLKFIKGRHWYKLDFFNHIAWEKNFEYTHILRYHQKPLHKRKYGLRKKHFVKYESHRNKNIDYLPF